MDDFAEEEVVENPTLRAAYNLAPLHQNQPLCWDYEVHLKGEKIHDKMIHLCETCELPILVYGRLLPCKHIFCFDCARKCDKFCKRCGLKVQKVEKSALGTVYVCTHGAPKHSTTGCRRTYLSQRDLQAHIAHRHTPKESSSNSIPSSISVPSQPVPNQLPLTKQQAAQQASQKQAGAQEMPHVSPGQSHHLSSVLPMQNSLVPQMTNLPINHQQPLGMSVNSQQLSSAHQLIPGLGDLRPISTVAQSVIPQNSPLMQPSPNSNNLPQGMNLPYNTTCPPNSDIFHPLDMNQQQQMQQTMGIPGSHMQPNQTHQPYLQPSQFPVSTNMMQQMNAQQMNAQQMNAQQMNVQQMNAQQMNTQQMNVQQMNNQQLSSTVTPSMHPNSFTHSHSSMSGSQNMDSYNEPISQPRTNVNLITVPIQDEGQYRPLPYITSSLTPHPNSPYPQPHLSMPNQTQTYTQPSLPAGTYSTPTTYPQMTSQSQNMAAPNSPQGLPFNQSGTLHAANPGQMGNPLQMLGGNVHLNPPRAMVDVMHAMSMAAVRPQGGGLMPTPGNGGQGVVNRFPQGGHWAPQRIIPPRMTQGQQRPHTEGQFNQSGYYH